MHFCCRAPYGARGLKYRTDGRHAGVASRAPYGARGLKFSVLCPLGVVLSVVAPRMGRVD